MGFLGGFMKVFNKVAPFLKFIPVIGQYMTVIQMALNAINALTQKPPNWKGAIMGAISGALGSGFQDALKAFGGGTALDFSKLFGGKLSDMFGGIAQEVAKSDALPQFIKDKFGEAMRQLQEKVMSEGFQKQMAALVNEATGTKEGDFLTRSMIEGAASTILGGGQSILNPFGTVLVNAVERELSTYSGQQRPPVSLPRAEDTPQLSTDVPAQRPPRSYDV